MVFEGDCLHWLDWIELESVDLVYIDPPFFTQRNFKQFDDRWSSMAAYIDWVRARVVKLHKVLKPTGSIMLHCDWHASHYLRVMLDEVFGYERFVNEIIWSYTKVANSRGKKLLRAHDTIYFYSKSKKHTFNRMFEDTPSEIQKRLIKSGYNTKKQFGNRYFYVYDKNKVKEKVKQKKINLNDFDKIIDVDVKKGRPYTDVLALSSLNGQAKERLGYPTQKPEALLTRLIKCTTNAGDTVLDCFGGSGTTAAVAKKLGRKFITGDVSPVACEIMRKRLV